MGKPKVPNTISDKEWTRIRKNAGKQETRDGGMFSKKAVTRRHHNIKMLKNAGNN